MAEPVVLSGSSLNTFLRCGAQWMYAYVYRLKRPPTLKQALGTSGHAAAELNLRQKITSRIDLPLDVVLDAFRDSFKEESYESAERPERRETKPVFLDSGIAAVRVWREVVSPTYQPTMVEQHVQFALNGIPIDGTVDVVDEEGVIRDHKFVGKKPSATDGTYVLNMTGYAIGYRRLTGGIETGIVLDHIVRTKVPYHVPIVSNGPVPDDAIVAYAGIVETVKRSIDAGIFPPTGLKSNACSWCGFRDICPAYRRT